MNHQPLLRLLQSANRPIDRRRSGGVGSCTPLHSARGERRVGRAAGGGRLAAGGGLTSRVGPIRVDGGAHRLGDGLEQPAAVAWEAQQQRSAGNGFDCRAPSRRQAQCNIEMSLRGLCSTGHLYPYGLDLHQPAAKRTFIFEYLFECEPFVLQVSDLPSVQDGVGSAR